MIMNLETQIMTQIIMNTFVFIMFAYVCYDTGYKRATKKIYNKLYDEIDKLYNEISESEEHEKIHFIDAD